MGVLCRFFGILRYIDFMKKGNCMTDNNAVQILSLVKELLKKEYSDTSYMLWFDILEIVSIDENRVVLSSGDEFKYNIVKTRYLDVIAEKFNEVMGFPLEVDIILNKPEPSSKSAAQTLSEIGQNSLESEENKTAAVRTDDFLNHNDYTFDNFIVGGSNKFAHAACVAVAETPGSVYNPLFIYGPSGLGKTHLMYAVTNEILKKKPNTKLVYIKCEDFTIQLIDAISKKSTAAFREKFRRADILLIDDIQFVAGKESTQEELFHTFNTLYEDHKQIILTCDRPARDIKYLEDRLKTRFEWGLIADIQPPDTELRAAIIKKKAETLGVSLSNDVIAYLSEKLKSNVRQIEGAVKRLSATSFISGEKITVELAQRCLSDIVSEDIPLSMKINRILYTVSEKYGVEVEDIKGKKRIKEVAWARHVAIYILRTKTDMSLPAIGEEFSGRDHSTILNSYRTIENEIRDNPSFAVEMNELINEIDI